MRSPLFTCLIQLSGTDEGHISDDTIWKALYTNAEEFKKLAKYGMTCLVLSPQRVRWMARGP